MIVVTLVKLGLCSSENYDGCCGKKNERKCEKKRKRKKATDVVGTKRFSAGLCDRPVLKDPFSTGRFDRY